MNDSKSNLGSTCVVGFGAITAVGKSAIASAAAVRAGIAGFVDHPYMLNLNDEPMVVASAPYLADDLILEDRIFELALRAAREALEPLEALTPSSHSIAIIGGLSELRPGLPVDQGLRLAAQLKNFTYDNCHITNVEIIQKGHSAGLIAIGAGCQKIKSGDTEFCLVGGVDSYLDSEILDWLEGYKQLHTTYNAWGFVPGEAAGFCLLCSEKTARRYKLPVLGRIIAISTAYEQNKIKTRTVCIGHGLSLAVGQVLHSLPSNALIDHTICDQNGEPYRADEFGFMLARYSERFVNPSDFLAPADCWGDIGAASGPLFVLLTVVAGMKGYGKGPLTLLWTSSEGGERTAAIVQTLSTF